MTIVTHCRTCGARFARPFRLPEAENLARAEVREMVFAHSRRNPTHMVVNVWETASAESVANRGLS